MFVDVPCRRLSITITRYIDGLSGVKWSFARLFVLVAPVASLTTPYALLGTRSAARILLPTLE